MRAPQANYPRFRHRGRYPAAPARARPRVHCITNAVAQNFTANMLLAAGAVPSMTHRAERDRRLRGARRRAAGQSRHLRRGAARGGARGASSVAGKDGVPWVLDPVFIDRSPPRAAFAQDAGRAEAARDPAQPRRVRRALAAAKPDERALARYALDTLAVVALTGDRRSGHRRRAASRRSRTAIR